MYQYKTTTGDDVAIQFYQSTKASAAATYRYGTQPGLACRPSTASKAVQAVNSTSSSPTSTPNSNLNESLQKNSASCSSTSTPSVCRRKKNSVDRNTCKKCQIPYAGRMDNEYNSLWINCEQRNCDYWVHIACLGLVVTEEKEQEFSENVKFFCQTHNPNKIPRPRSILK